MQNLLRKYKPFYSSSLHPVKLAILILLNLLYGQQIFAQQINERSENLRIKSFKEEIFLRTDRDIYISGEQVWFKIYRLNGLTHIPCDISKVVYVELLDKNNYPLKQLKVKADANSASTSFILPDNISSGNYIIRAYTNWMQNFTTDQFFYKTISVINPFETPDHISLQSNSKDKHIENSSAEEVLQTFIIGEDGNQLQGSSLFKENSDKIIYRLTLAKPVFSTRDKVKIEISATDMTGKPVESEISVSVAKAVVVNSSPETSFYRYNSMNEVLNRADSNEYLAELEGNLISGFMRFKTTDEPLKNTAISLSYVGKTARCQFGNTDGNGEFNFVVKESGLNEIVIQPLSPDITGYYTELIQPFSGSFNNYRTKPLSIDSSKINEINNAIVSMQINDIYEPYRQNKEAATKSMIPDFYGKPENTIKMADYIEMGSVREVVKEIIPNVYTLKQNGKFDFKLINKFKGQPFENKPLVLVDGVPIYDFEKVLSINSREIERADIINTRYFYSDNVFDGIVSFITKKGNLSALEFDNSIFRQVYEACMMPGYFYSPDYTSEKLRNSRIPDYRNTLYWGPDLRTGKDGKAEVEFYTSDEKGDYMIVVEGVSQNGKPGFSKTIMVVK